MYTSHSPLESHDLVAPTPPPTTLDASAMMQDVVNQVVGAVAGNVIGGVAGVTPSALLAVRRGLHTRVR